MTHAPEASTFATTTTPSIQSPRLRRLLLLPAPRRRFLRRARSRAANVFDTAVAIALVALFCLALFGCAGGYAGSGLQSLAANAATIDAGQTIRLAAQSSTAGPITWSISSPSCTASACGSVTSTGGNDALYTAPPSLTSPIQVTLIATTTGTSNHVTTVVTVNPDPSIPAIPPSGIVGAPYTTSLPPVGGTGHVTVTLLSGTVPAGLNYDPSTGLVTGTPTAPGSFTFTLRGVDQSDIPYTFTVSKTILIVAPGTPLSIATTGNPPNGIVALPYFTQLIAVGGTQPYTWQLVSGALPNGLLLDPATGAIQGTPTKPGSFPFTVTVTDANGNTATASFTISVVATPVTLTLDLSSLPNGNINVFYSSTINVSGGVAPYTCAILSGALPTGLTLGPNCLVSGTPTVAGSFTFTVQATDSSSPDLTTTGQFTIVILPAPVTFTFGNPLPGTIEVVYNQTILINGGTAPYTCALLSGSLPTGLTLNPNCTLTGTPVASGNFTFRISVTDGGGNTGTGLILLVINPATLTFTPTVLPNGTVNIAYSQTFVITGGLAPYTCAFASGALPAGLALNPNCTLTGTPTVSGTFTFAVKASDSAQPADTVTTILTLTVNPAPLSLTTGKLPDGTLLIAYNQPLVITGGTAPYTCQYISGTLPTGLVLNPNCTVSGIPLQPGPFTFVVRITDAANPAQTLTATLTLRIDVADITIVVAAPLPGTVDVTYTGGLIVTGGFGPYTCALASGSLPAGLTLNPNCSITGIPTTAGPSTFTVVITDSDNPQNTLTTTLTMVINPAALMLTTGNLPNGTVNVLYADTLTITGGTAPYTCTILSGSLPTGLTLNANCTVTGTPTVATTKTIQVQVTDSSSPQQTTSGPETITILPAPVTLTLGNPPAATDGQPYTGHIPTGGGTAPYICALTSGTLPAGLTLNPNCTVTGTPTVVITKNHPGHPHRLRQPGRHLHRPGRHHRQRSPHPFAHRHRTQRHRRRRVYRTLHRHRRRHPVHLRRHGRQPARGPHPLVHHRHGQRHTHHRRRLSLHPHGHRQRVPNPNRQPPADAPHHLRPRPQQQPAQRPLRLPLPGL